MSILINRDTRVLVQGVTSELGNHLAKKMIREGTNIVGGVTPGKGGEWVLNGKNPIFDSLRAAIKTTEAEATIVVVPPRNAADAIFESIDLAIPLIVCITKGLPIQEMMRIKYFLKGKDTILIGPNSPGIYSPGEMMLGIIPDMDAVKGNVGIISRSGTLAYEVMHEISNYGIGVSTFIGIGADPIVGFGFSDLLPFFEEDPSTEKMILLGEIGGEFEEEAANYISRHFTKPVLALVVGKSAPANSILGHAGAVITNNCGSAQRKIEVLRDAGVLIADIPEDIPVLLNKI
jgi:succinyl-CoA synthetase alpha subunit